MTERMDDVECGYLCGYLNTGVNVQKLALSSSCIYEAETVVHWIFDSWQGDLCRCLSLCSPIRSLIEHGFEASSRKDVRLYYGADNLQKMAYQVCGEGYTWPTWQSQFATCFFVITPTIESPSLPAL